MPFLTKPRGWTTDLEADFSGINTVNLHFLGLVEFDAIEHDSHLTEFNIFLPIKAYIITIVNLLYFRANVVIFELIGHHLLGKSIVKGFILKIISLPVIRGLV